MPSFSDFWKFIQGKMLGGKTYQVTSSDLDEYVKTSKKWNELSQYKFAVHTGINIIANALSSCEIRTFRDWKEIRESQYYTWNYQPNQNENSNQFIHHLVENMILNNECLVIQTRRGDLLIADTYTHEHYAMYQDVFRDVTVGQSTDGMVTSPYTFPQKFKMSNVLYYRLSNENVQKLLMELVAEYCGLMEVAVDKFIKSGGERGILTIDAMSTTANYGTKPDGTPRTFNDVYTELMNKQFKDYFKSSTAVLPLFKGFHYDQKTSEALKRSTSEIKDVSDIDDKILEKVAQALMIPPQLMKGDVADVSQLTKNLLTFGVSPIASIIETENNRKSYGEAVLTGSFQKIDTSRIIHMTPQELATASDKMIACGAWNIDDVRVKAGDVPLMTEWSQRHVMTKNYADITDVIATKEGEQNA
jgi:HK97 family phage portal protein